MLRSFIRRHAVALGCYRVWARRAVVDVFGDPRGKNVHFKSLKSTREDCDTCLSI